MSERMSDEEDSIHRAFRDFLRSLPPSSYGSLMNLVHLIRESPYPSSTDVVEEQDELGDIIYDTRQNEKIVPVPSETVSQQTPLLVTREKMRPLNCFIAFRSYYSTAFPDLTQKAKSGILRSMWKVDLFKAKWAILAKAYSILRDHHGKDVSLDSFLFLTARYIGIIEPSAYFQAMGLTLVLDSNHQYVVEKKSDVQVDLSHTTTNFCVPDVVNYCYDAGYVCRISQLPSPPEDKVEQIVRFAAQPYVARGYDPTVITRSNDQYQDDNNAGMQEYDFYESPNHQSPLSGSVEIDPEVKGLLNSLDLAIDTFGLGNCPCPVQDLNSDEPGPILSPLSPPPSEMLDLFHDDGPVGY